MKIEKFYIHIVYHIYLYIHVSDWESIFDFRTFVIIYQFQHNPWWETKMVNHGDITLIMLKRESGPLIWEVWKKIVDPLFGMET